jgi:hypothetical protein
MREQVRSQGSERVRVVCVRTRVGAHVQRNRSVETYARAN